MERVVLGKVIHTSHPEPFLLAQSRHTHQEGRPCSYLAEEPEDGVDLGMQHMDGGQQPVLVAPEQLVDAAHGEQRLLVQQQQHLRGKLQRG